MSESFTSRVNGHDLIDAIERVKTDDPAACVIVRIDDRGALTISPDHTTSIILEDVPS